MTPTLVQWTDCRTGEARQARAWDVGIPGLVLQEIRTDGGQPGWIAVHVATSATVGYGYTSPEPAVASATVGYGYTSPEPAVAAMRRLADLADWTADADTLRSLGIGPAAAAATVDGDIDMPDAPDYPVEPRR